jgi:hypothetical protein
LIGLVSLVWAASPRPKAQMRHKVRPLQEPNKTTSQLATSFNVLAASATMICTQPRLQRQIPSRAVPSRSRSIRSRIPAEIGAVADQAPLASPTAIPTADAFCRPSTYSKSAGNFLRDGCSVQPGFPKMLVSPNFLNGHRSPDTPSASFASHSSMAPDLVTDRNSVSKLDGLMAFRGNVGNKH